jgi:PST family polysaccharide transporter
MRKETSHGRGQDDHLRTDHLHGDLNRLALRGGALTIASQGIKVAVQFITIIVLARLLAPEDFGRFAMVAAFLIVFELFKDLGLSTATVQRQTITNGQVSTLFWLNAGLGAAVAAGFAALAPILTRLYGEPILLQITPVVALTLLITGLASQHLALLRRQMRFFTLAVVQNGADIVSLVAAVAAALMGWGLWSLVVQRLVWSVVISGGAWLACDWRPGRPGRFAEVRGMVAFGGNATAAMVLGRLAGNLDKVLLGWYWGPVTLGLFERSQKLLLAPIQNLNAPLAMVALSTLSRLTDQPERYREAYVAAAERLAMLIAPIAALMMVGAEPVVALVLGPQWADAAPILSWMGLAAVYMPITYTLSWLYMSQDRTSEMLVAGCVGAALAVLVLVAALPLGVVWVAAAYAVSGVVLRVPVLLWLAGRRGPVGMRQFGRILVLPVAAVVAASALMVVVQSAPFMAHMPSAAAAALLAAVAFGASLCVYGAVPRGRRILRHTVNLPRIMLRREVSA